MQVTAEQELQDNQNAETLASFMNVDVEVARRVLRKHKGNMDKAADALLAGDTAAESWDTQRRHQTTPEPMYADDLNTDVPSQSKALVPSATVIDLTVDDDEMTRALQMSMEESTQTQHIPEFGPSDRAPHPDWQMVRSNNPVIPASTREDHTLSKAIQASLQDFKEDVDMSPLKESIREGGRPIALRPDIPSLAYAALVLQALFFVPQVRATVSNLRLPPVDPNALISDPDRAMHNLIELFTNMDLAQLAAIIDNEVLPSLEVLPFDGRQSLAESSGIVVTHVGHLIEQHMEVQAVGVESNGLFSFAHGKVAWIGTEPDRHKLYKPSERVVSTITVEFGGEKICNDLVTSLRENLTHKNSHDVIFEPAEVFSFKLIRRPPPAGSAKVSPDPFGYPKTMFLDRFLYENVVLTNAKQKLERSLLDEIKDYTGHKESLTRCDNHDTLQDLRSTIYYYENVADPEGDPARKRNIEQMIDQLKDLQIMITGKIEGIERHLESLQAEVSSIYDCEELQQYQYDLRAVLVHTGLPGRKQMYSYVQDIDGIWWKTVDQDVTEVPEEAVLSDPTGLHLGAGPYMLIYSRHLSDEQLREPLVWPTLFTEAVEENNKKFLAMMHPELDIFATPQTPKDMTHPDFFVAKPSPTERLGRSVTISRKNSESSAMVFD